MKKYTMFLRPAKILVAGITAALSLQLNAAPVSLQEAQNVARNWMATKVGHSVHLRENLVATRTMLAQVSSDAPSYRIVQLESEGWVIVAGDDTVKPVLGYGHSRINTASLPPAFVSWMQGVDKAIKTAVFANRKRSDKKLGIASSLHPEWHRLKQEPDLFIPEAKSNKLGSNAPYVVKPLLWLGGNGESSGIQWNQTELYNALTPVDANGPDNHTLTGCVATAMGQVMRYYGKPSNGAGFFSYENTPSNTQYDPNGFQHDYGVQAANFGATAYDWGAMPIKLTAASTVDEVEAVSTLLYHAGVAVAMDYGFGISEIDGSTDGGSLSAYHDPNGGPAADTALKTYFGFSNARWAASKEYTYAEWKQKLKDSLESGNPVLYGGSGSEGGHAFVLDGYTTDDTFHFNWGWGGELNGQFSLLNLTPNGNQFSYNQQAIFISGFIGENDGGYQENEDNDNLGGGCTYNPHNKGIDLLMILMVLMATLYPFGRKYLR